MSNSKLISVIIPTYNVESYISQCLESLLCQSYKSLEIIVVDDGSTDNTIQIVEKYPVKVFKQENKGASSARNKGIGKASGEYIHFMDADDYLNLQFYERLISTIQLADIDLACCEFVHERLPALSTNFEQVVLISNIRDKILLTNAGNDGATVRFLIKRSLLSKHKLYFEESLSIAEDMLFNYKLIYYAKNIITVPDAVYFYKNRPNSIMTSGGKIKRINKKLIIKRAREMRDEFARQNNIPIVAPAKFSATSYKLLGIIPILTKKMFSTGRIRWYIFGVCFLQIKSK